MASSDAGAASSSSSSSGERLDPSNPKPNAASNEVSNQTAAVLNNDNNPNDSSCTACVQLLRQVVGTERPRALLEALWEGNSNNNNTSSFWEPLPNGLRVRLPPQTNDDDDDVKGKHAWWQQLSARNNNNNNSNNIPLAHSPSNDENQQPQQQEWMSVVCRPCANVGPEAGARAFVLGPQPLSIVVCQNRMLPLQPSVWQRRPWQSLNAQNNDFQHHNQRRTAELQTMLTHELVHIYDLRKSRLDLHHCTALAQSEIRAARYAECAHIENRNDGTNNNRNSSSTKNRQAQCVQDTAYRAVRNRFAAQQVRECLQEAWEPAWADERPFRTNPGYAASAKADAGH